jgi:hypothetical protein
LLAAYAVSLIRGALRGLLALLHKAGPEKKREIEASLDRDDCEQVGKPPIDGDDPAAREALVERAGARRPDRARRARG